MSNFGWIPQGPFGQTDWPTVNAAGQGGDHAARAKEKLCQTYWYPLYAYARQKRQSPDDAQDSTQEFLSRFMENSKFADLDPSKGKFRSFLLAAMNHFLANEWRRGRAKKRGGGAILSLDAVKAETQYLREPSHNESPDRLFEREWVRGVFARATKRLQQKFFVEGKREIFKEFKGLLEDEDGWDGHAAVAARLGKTEAAVRQAAKRFREDFQVMLREELVHSGTRPDELEEELACLRKTLGG